MFIYGGASRESALTTLVVNNNQPSLNTDYEATSDGILIVAYPAAADTETSLSFEYWVAEGEFTGAKQGEQDESSQ